MTDGALARGHYVEPTVVRVPRDSWIVASELFVPLVAVDVVDSLDEAFDLANDTPLGLTAGFFSRDQAEIDRFLDRIEAGVVYVNRQAGATTGAWPGVQPFGGWKGSGSGGKAGRRPVLRAAVPARAEPNDRGGAVVTDHLVQTLADAVAPALLTDLPGPEARLAIERDLAVSSPSMPRVYPLVPSRAEGCVIEDVDGNRFLDLNAGIAVNATGHCHPEVVAAIEGQAAPHPALLLERLLPPGLRRPLPAPGRPRPLRRCAGAGVPRQLGHRGRGGGGEAGPLPHRPPAHRGLPRRASTGGPWVRCRSRPARPAIAPASGRCSPACSTSPTAWPAWSSCGIRCSATW